jgi:hypothetical protein
MRRAAGIVTVVVLSVWMAGCANFSPIPRPARTARIAAADVTAPSSTLTE